MSYKYSIQKGVQKFKTKTLIIISIIGLLSGGVGLSFLTFGLTNATTFPDFQNGDFSSAINPGPYKTLTSGDSTSIPYWTVTSGSVDYIGTYWKAPTGTTRSLDMSGNDAGSISQTFSTLPGRSYEVTFDLSGNPDGTRGTKTLEVVAGNSSAKDYYFNTETKNNTEGNMMWETNTYDFTAASDSTTLTFTSLTYTAYGPALGNVKLSQPECTQVTTSDSTELSAALVNPSEFQGNLDASGCDVGIYFSTPGTVKGNSSIVNASKYGILVDGHSAKNVDISDSTIDNSYFGIYFTSGATGNVSNTTVSNYFKNGLSATQANTTVSFNNDAIIGGGPQQNVAQNGIEFAWGASGSARDNIINGNYYSGSYWSATGLLLFDVNANQVKTSQNKFLNNQRNLVIVTRQSCPSMYGGTYKNWDLCTYQP